jgi:hypothetical protein
LYESVAAIAVTDCFILSLYDRNVRETNNFCDTSGKLIFSRASVKPNISQHKYVVMCNVYHSETLTETKAEINKNETMIAATGRSMHVKISLVVL